MKNKNSKARMQIIFGTLLFALVLLAELYVMIHFSKMFIVIAVLAALDLGCLYLIINGLLIMKEQKELRQEEQYESIFSSEKASYLMQKKYFEEIQDKLNYLESASTIPTEEIVNAQKGIAKVIINRSRENTSALMNSNDAVMERFEGVMSRLEELTQTVGENQSAIDANREALTAIVNAGKEAIVEGQKNISDLSDKSLQVHVQELIVSLKDMELRLNNAIMEEQKLIAQIPSMIPQVQMAPVVQAAAAPTVQSVEETQRHAEQPAVEEISVMESEPVLEELPVMESELGSNEFPSLESEPALDELMPDELPSLESMPATDEQQLDSVLEDAGIALESLMDELPEIEMDPASLSEVGAVPEDVIPEPMPDIMESTEPEPVVEEIMTESVELEPIIEESIEEPIAEASVMPDLSDPNKKLSADDIDALFASMGVSEPTAEEEPIVEEMKVESVEEASMMAEAAVELTAEEEPEMEPIAVEGIAEPTVEPELESIAVESIAEPAVDKPIMPDFSDPNRALSADDIDALFASMGANETSAEAAAQEPIPEPIPMLVGEKAPMPDLSDPNRALSADDIDALFASMGVNEAAAKPEAIPEPIPMPEPVVEAMPEPIPMPTPEPEEEKPPMPDLSDPNKKLSADDIAALFANMA